MLFAHAGEDHAATEAATNNTTTLIVVLLITIVGIGLGMYIATKIRKPTASVKPDDKE